MHNIDVNLIEPKRFPDASKRRKILVGTLLVTATAAFCVFMVQQLQFESQLDDLKRFCGGLKIQASVDEIRLAAAISPGLRMVLLEPGADGAQIGSVFFEGAGRGGCSLTFMRGRLTQKTFFFGAKDPTKPGEVLKPW